MAMRPTAEQVIKLTDKVCADLLDEEYAVCRFKTDRMVSDLGS